MSVAARPLALLAAALATLLLAPLPAAAQARTATYRIGPISVGGYASEYKATFDLPKPRGARTSLRFMHARLVDAKGRFVPQEEVMLHHVTFVNRGRFDGDRRQSYCGTGIKERFYGTGEEDQSLVLPRGYGYRVRAKDRWHASWMLMNHRPVRRKVFIEYTMRYARGWSDTPVTPHWIGVQPCLRDPIFQVPGGGAPASTFSKSITWRPPRDGRIVAVGTHVHGGARSMRITDPGCGGRTLAESVPQYGLEDDPIYRVLPQVHEPSPRFTSYPLSATGIPVRGGRAYRAEALYDNELPHARVMGIMHAYVAPPAPGTDTPDPCPPLPDDVRTIDWDKPYRLEIPRVHIPLAVRGPDGRARAVDTLPGPFWRPRGEGLVVARGIRFNHAKIALPVGGTLRYRMDDPVHHDVTTANGPTAVGTQPLKDGESVRVRFKRPGTYQLYCTLHPLDMQQVVQVG